ncbi:BrnA antitoxin family protein [Kaistia dalseonensis]|nr:BrnA antitoxin family protein [Kaistia dalseonensis]
MGPGQTDLVRLDAVTEEEIERQAIEDGDGDIDWSTLEVVIPAEKTAISIRVDQDVLDFFKEAGPGYQTRINAVLRSYMEQKRKAG